MVHLPWQAIAALAVMAASRIILIAAVLSADLGAFSLTTLAKANAAVLIATYRGSWSGVETQLSGVCCSMCFLPVTQSLFLFRKPTIMHMHDEVIAEQKLADGWVPSC
jgi:hypothetical protein